MNQLHQNTAPNFAISPREVCLSNTQSVGAILLNDMEKICGIYKITNPKGKVYIGQSIDIRRRWNEHRNYNNKKCAKLKASLIFHGKENHTFEVIDFCLPSELNEKEKYYVGLYHSFDRELGLNLKDGGGNSVIVSEEVKEKIKKSWIQRRIIGTSETTRINMNLGKKGTPSKRKGKTLLDYHSIKEAEIIRKKMSAAAIIFNKNRLNKCTKSIWQIDKSGIKIRMFSGIAEAARALSIPHRGSGIKNVLRKRSNTCYGFYWEYVKHEPLISGIRLL